MKAGFSFTEVQNMYLSQITTLLEAIPHMQSQDIANNMGWMRVAYHAESEDFERIVKDIQRK